MAGILISGHLPPSHVKTYYTGPHTNKSKIDMTQEWVVGKPHNLQRPLYYVVRHSPKSDGDHEPYMRKSRQGCAPLVTKGKTGDHLPI